MNQKEREIKAKLLMGDPRLLTDDERKFLAEQSQLEPENELLKLVTLTSHRKHIDPWKR